MAKIAIVTGASSGIGAEFCSALDARGLDEIWLIARRKDSLDAVASKLSIRCRVIPSDLSIPDGRAQVAGLLSSASPDVRFLVNCAGLGRFGDSFSIDPRETRSMMEVNMAAVVEVTSACIPFMSSGSRIITLCSEAAYVAAYRLGVYAASKAFVRSYLDSLRLEVADRGISVLEVSPGWVDTPFIQGVESTFKAPRKVFGSTVSREDVVSKAMKDSERGRRRSVCGFSTRAAIAMATHFPRLAAWYWRRMWGRSPHPSSAPSNWLLYRLR